MSTVSVTLNGSRVRADTNETILHVARRNGICIPTLCHEDRLEPTGSCRVCLVKVKGAKNHVPSCSTKVTVGMVIDTEDPEVIEARHMSLALLISDHYGDCVSPCSLECPANIDIQGYIALIASGRYRDALALIKKKISMPLAIGRICPHPCESVCRRNRVEEPIAINNLKRFVADYDIARARPFLPEKTPSNGKKVAVIGSGPAGLSAGYYLAVRGYGVTIYEREEHAGGMLRYGIPEYRLPKDILDKEIDLILTLGIDIHYNSEFGRDITAEELKRRGFDAVFLGIGAQKSVRMRIEGEDSEGVLSGIGFLHDCACGKEFDFSGKTVVVVGGGNTAMDASRTSVRLGARKVIVLYRRTRKEMPANDAEIREAEEEGIEFQFLSAPVKVKREEKYLAAECIRMELGEPDASGRRRPVPVVGSNYSMEAHYIITAIGQRPEPDGVAGLDLLTAKDLIFADWETGTTGIDHIFAAGDCVTGAATAVEAIAGGRRAAESIDAYLRNGKKQNKRPADFNVSKGMLADIPDDIFGIYEKESRVIMPTIRPGQRVNGFDEIEAGITEGQAKKEAVRCLECGCIAGFSCGLREESARYGIATDEYTGAKNIYPEKNSLTPRRPPIVKDANKCIKCGICVRICDEVWGLNIFGFKNRGFETEVAPYFDLDLSHTACDYCGQCADACPTGALALSTNLPKPGPFKVKKVEGHCINCSLGCELDWNIYGNRLVQTTGRPLAGENEGNLCVRGRFGYEYLHSADRQQKYFSYTDEGAMPIAPEQAMELAAANLSGKTRVGILTSTSLSNEEYAKLHELAQCLGSARVFHIPWDFAEKPGDEYSVVGRTPELAECIGGIKKASLSDIDKSDAVILFNIRPGRSFPILEMKIRHAVKKGLRLYIVNNRPLRLDEFSDSVFRVREDRYKKFLDFIGYIRYLNSGRPSARAAGYYEDKKIDSRIPLDIRIKREKITDFIRNTLYKRCIFIVDEDMTDSADLEACAMNALVQKNHAQILLMRRGANPEGALQFTGNHNTKPINGDTVNGFDTLFLYKLPEIFQDTHSRVVHVGFKPGSYRRGVFIPSSSLLEHGGTRYLYNGKLLHERPILQNESALDNIKTLESLIPRISHV